MNPFPSTASSPSSYGKLRALGNAADRISNERSHRSEGSTRILRVVFGILPNPQDNGATLQKSYSPSAPSPISHLPSSISAAQRPSLPSAIHHLRRRRRPSGYLLLELILAMTLFGLAVLGLARTLQMTIQTSAIIRRDHEVRIALRCFLEEVRRKPLAELTQSYLDPRLNLTLQSTAEPLELRDYNGTVLTNLYKLRVFTNYEAGAEMHEEALEVFIYKTQTETQQ